MPTLMRISHIFGLSIFLLSIVALDVRAFGAIAAPPPTVIEFSLSAERLRSCIERVLREHGQTPLTLRQRDRVLLMTPFAWVSADELDRISRTPGGSAGKWTGGRYRLLFTISALNSGGGELAITSQILADPVPGATPGSRLMGPGGGPMRGIPVGSNGSLEGRWREILKKGCGG